MSLDYAESVLTFRCESDELLGIVSAPRANESVNDLGIIIVVGGPQYRAGSHRQFVQLARSLAESGVTSLRFDYRGMGDSSGVQRDFLQVIPDIKAAIDAFLLTCPKLKRVVLWGLCDAAAAALLYCDATQDARVSGLVALNPWVRSDQSLARTQVKHYYLDRLRQPEFWRKLLSGKVAMSAISGLSKNIQKARSMKAKPGASQLPFQDRMARACAEKSRAVLLILSGQDYIAKEFLEVSATSQAWRGTLTASHIERHDLLDADHTFSTIAAKSQVAALTDNWVLGLPSS